MNRILVIYLVSLTLASISQAQQPPEAAPAPQAATAARPEKTTGTQAFQGLSFGIGLSLTHDLGDFDRIQEAQIIDGIVRVTKERNDIPRLMLESHYFFPLGREVGDVKERLYGHGPFVGIQTGSNEILEAIGLGWMFGFRKSFTDSQSFNLGFGAVVDPEVRTLGDGVVANMPICPPPPTVCTPELRFKETSQWGALVIVSFGF